MTETPAPTRAFARYDSEEPAEVSLPGYLNAIPSIVSPGDVFSFEPEYAEQLTAGDSSRFTIVDEDDAVSPYADLTIAELLELLPADEAEALKNSNKPEILAAVDEWKFTHPDPPGAPNTIGADEDPDTVTPGDVDAEGNPDGDDDNE
jgi:hypothetical protein